MKWIKLFKLLLICIISLFLLTIISCSKPNSEYTDTQWKYDTFAKCLTEKGAVMYGTEWCSHCKNQKELFGNSYRFINYIDCEKQASKCFQDGVKGYPTWIIDGKMYAGEQQFLDLAFVSGCQFTEDIIEIKDTA